MIYLILDHICHLFDGHSLAFWYPFPSPYFSKSPLSYFFEVSEVRVLNQSFQFSCIQRGLSTIIALSSSYTDLITFTP